MGRPNPNSMSQKQAYIAIGIGLILLSAIILLSTNSLTQLAGILIAIAGVFLIRSRRK